MFCVWQPRKQEKPHPKLAFFLNLCISAKLSLLLRAKQCWKSELAQRENDLVLLLSPNKSIRFSVCGQALVPASCSADGWALGCLMDRLHSVKTGPMASHGLIGPMGPSGKALPVCVNGRSCRGTVASCGRVVPPYLSLSYSLSLSPSPPPPHLLSPSQLIREESTETSQASSRQTLEQPSDPAPKLL